MTESQTWFRFDGAEPILARILKVTMAGYSQGADGDIVAWAEETCNPDRAVMFLITSRCLRPWGKGKIAVSPSYFVTDGERWHPLMQCVGAKYRSYASGYTGAKFSEIDKKMIIERIEHYVKSIVGE